MRTPKGLGRKSVSGGGSWGWPTPPWNSAETDKTSRQATPNRPFRSCLTPGGDECRFLPEAEAQNGNSGLMNQVKTNSRRICHALPMLAWLVVLSGCAANRYQVPVSTFRNQTLQTIGVLSDFYSSRNSYEIDLYLQGVAADSSIRVETVYADGEPTPLGKPVFSPVSIKARLDALNLVSVYASRLYDLAIIDAPSRFQSAATVLGQNLSSLDKTFQSLRGTDPTANKYIGPTSSLIVTIGEIYLDHKRGELITKAITEGAPQVNIILSLVRDDMERIFSLEVSTGANEKLATLIPAYNNDRCKLTFEQRMTRLSEIKAAAAEASASVGAAPANLVTSMMDALKALVQAANSSKKAKPATIAALNSALEAWTTQIQSLSGQVKLLIH